MKTLSGYKVGTRVAATPWDEPEKVYYGTVLSDANNVKYIKVDGSDDWYYPTGKDVVRALSY